ncbi:phosphopyruvate hydratase [Candidatus Woesearchaeota archaeon]|nr:phosphopyruvate hydratase [Candidatus Woesearchaeota archaeon]
MLSKIKKIVAREVLDSRGNPTIEVDVFTEKCFASAIVPSGASTGSHEALELRDGDKSRYNGKGVLKAVDNVNKIISKKVVGLNCENQNKIDELMVNLDGTENKSNLGGNSILGVSMAMCKAAALEENIPLYAYIKQLNKNSNNRSKKNNKSQKYFLPVPQLNIMNGGKHAGMENGIQEHMIMPIKFKSFSEALRAGVEVYHALGKILKEKFGSQGILLGDEGGYVPQISNVDERLELIDKAIENAGYKNKIFLALDCAASEFFYSDYYKIGSKNYSTGELIYFYKNLIKKYGIISIEDGMAEDHWNGWEQLNKELGSKIQIIGDDLLVTNTKRIAQAVKEKACNALLLKVNQIGTVTEAIEAANLASKDKWSVVVSHRSGETEDSFIADLVVGLNAGQSKFGAPARSERTAKYNRLLRIEEELGNKAEFAKF